MEEQEYIPVEQDMAVYDRLPRPLRRFLDQAPVGLEAVPVAELYDKKVKELTPLYSLGEVAEMVIKALVAYMKRNEGVVDFRVVEVIPHRRRTHRRERRMRMPRRIAER